MTSERFDTFELSIYWQRLQAIADECWYTFKNTAFSPIITEALDIGCEVMDSRGLTLSHATRGMPVFNLVLPNVTAAVISKFGDQIRPGDAFITNDPWLCAGHLPDVAVVNPVFKGEKLLGFVGSIANVVDIGGSLSRSQARELFDEGLQIPPMRLIRSGTYSEDLLEIIAENVRESESVLGDLQSQVSANITAGNRLLEFAEEYGLEEVDSLGDQIRSLSESAMRAAIAALPDGTYTASDSIELLDGSVEINIEIRVAGDEIGVDFPDCPPQTAQGANNAALSYVTAHCVYMFQCLLAPDVPSNNGSFRPISVWAPQGSMLNCQRPAAVGLRTMTGWHVHPLILKAMAPVIADRVIAPSGGLSWLVFSGRDQAGDSFQEHMVVSGGMGASKGGDGVAACGFPAATAGVPVEVVESRSPVLIERKEYVIDSGGPGQNRGGLGQRIVIRRNPTWSGPVHVSASLDHMQHPPEGVEGGSSGGPSRFYIKDDGGQITQPRTRQATLENNHQLLVVEVAGGGGYGDPKSRPDALVLQDVEEGLVSATAAADVYGFCHPV